MGEASRPALVCPTPPPSRSPRVCPCRRYVKNTSNTNVVHWGDRLWTLFEAGQPYRLNPATLETEVGCGGERWAV